MTINKDNPLKFTIRKAVQADLPVLVNFLTKVALHVTGERPHFTLKKVERSRLMAELDSSQADPNKLFIAAETSLVQLVGMGY